MGIIRHFGGAGPAGDDWRREIQTGKESRVGAGVVMKTKKSNWEESILVQAGNEVIEGRQYICRGTGGGDS